VKQLFQHQDKLYLILRNIPCHNFFYKDGSLNQGLLRAWREWLGADHILKQNERFLFVETIQDAIIEE
jgi:hypothetical protein